MLFLVSSVYLLWGLLVSGVLLDFVSVRCYVWLVWVGSVLIGVLFGCCESSRLC